MVVSGSKSEEQGLKNSVYQGTVLGPPLWNCYYEDSRLPVNTLGFTETAFADDLQAYKAFVHEASDDELRCQMAACQSALHSWGCTNQVQIDAEKDSFHILARRPPPQENFKLLGVTFDPTPATDAACLEVAGQAHARLRRFLSAGDFSVQRC